jgi:signal transduction histidine kinase
MAFDGPDSASSTAGAIPRERVQLSVLGASLFFGLVVWVLDALFDAKYFYAGHSFADLLLFKIPPHELCVRSFMLLAFIAFGSMISRVVARRRLAEAELQKARDLLEIRVTERTDELRRHTERLKILQRIARASLQLDTPEEIARQSLVELSRLLPFQRGAVHRFDLDTGESELVAVLAGGSTSLGAGSRIPLSEHRKIFEVLQQGEHFLIEDTLEVSEKWPIARILAGEGIRCILAHPLSFRSALIGALCISWKEPGACRDVHVDIAREVSDTLALAFQNARLIHSVEEQFARLRTLNTRLAEAEECERRRLARELHDRVGPNLSALTVNMGILRRITNQSPTLDAMDRIDDSLAVVDDTMNCIRDVMADLRPPGLDDFGLPGALRILAGRFSRRTGIQTMLDNSGFSSQLPPPVEIACFRIVQEALTNVTRHAQARRVWLNLQELEGTTRLVIADDGVGFSPTDFRSPGGQKPGWGLIGMRERAEAVGGTFLVDSSPGKGTRVVVEIEERQDEHSCVSCR